MATNKLVSVHAAMSISFSNLKTFVHLIEVQRTGRVRNAVLPGASGGNEETLCGFDFVRRRRLEFLLVKFLPLVTCVDGTLYSSQLGTSLSVQQIALDSAFSPHEKEKKKSQSL